MWLAGEWRGGGQMGTMAQVMPPLGCLLPLLALVFPRTGGSQDYDRRGPCQSGVLLLPV